MAAVVSAVALVFFWPAVAFADVLQHTALGNLTDQLMAVLVPVFVAFIGSLASWALLKLSQKLHIQVSQQTQEAWGNLAQQAAMRAAEWARQKVKTLEEGKSLPGGDVLDVAVNWALQVAEANNLPAIERDHLIGLIESKLFALRLATTPASTKV